MPAETHQHREAAGPDAVLELLAYVADVDDEHPAEVRLADLQLDDTFSMMGLWDAVVEELGERSVGADPTSISMMRHLALSGSSPSSSPGGSSAIGLDASS